MPKKSAEAFVMSDSMWGRPLRSTAGSAADKKAPRTQAEVTDDVDSDVDDELEDGEDAEADLADENDDELESEEATAADTADEPDDEEDEDSDDDDDLDPEDVVDAGTDGEVTAAVADDDEDASNETGANNRKVTMSEKKSGADHIRDEIAKRQKAGDSLRGVDIVSALAKRKIEVSPAQVSQLLKKAGLGGAPRGKRAASGEEAKSRVAARGKAKPAAEAPRATPKRPAAATPGKAALPMAQLKAAATFLAACDGCYTTAEEILSTHKQLGSVYDVSR